MPGIDSELSGKEEVKLNLGKILLHWIEKKLIWIIAYNRLALLLWPGVQLGNDPGFLTDG